MAYLMEKETLEKEDFDEIVGLKKVQEALA